MSYNLSKLNFKRVAPRAVAVVALVLASGCNFLTDPGPSSSVVLPGGEPSAEPSKAVLATLEELAGLEMSAASERFQSLPVEQQAVLRTTIMGEVETLQALESDDQRKRRFESLTPEMQSAVRLALTVSRIEKTETFGEKTPYETKGDQVAWGTWYQTSVLYTATAINAWGAPMFAVHQMTNFAFSGSATVVLAANTWGTVFMPAYVCNGLIASSAINATVFVTVSGQTAFGCGWGGWIYAAPVQTVVMTSTRVFASGYASFWFSV
jgi:hypothetical protein